MHSDLLYTLHYSPSVSPLAIRRKAEEWGRRHGNVKPLPPPPSDRDPDRRLRVGYLSPDFRAHTIAHLIEPILERHDRSQFEVYCYSAVKRPDELTARLRGRSDAWRDVTRLDDAAAARLIRHDGIDVLVELAGHMAENRLLVLAYRPAAVQVQLGYAGTTGLAAVDYRITDAHSDPPGAEAFYTERLVRLDQCAWPYRPSEESPDVGPPPLASAGHVTFGCLNKPAKVTDEAIGLWCRILDQVPGSRMILLSPPHNRALLQRFRRRGISADRVELAGRRSRRQYLELFNRIDIALDPFPYNGDTTTCDGLWMGVPLVTLAGETFVSRRGAGHLMNVGLGELVARDTEEYVQKAVALASDPANLSEIRCGLRDRMRNSALTDGRRYTAALESAYRDMWRARCNSVG